MVARAVNVPHELLSAINLCRITPRFQGRLASTSHIPRVAQPSLWQSVIPKFLRSKPNEPRSIQDTSESRTREWNPATSIILLGVLIGSQAIHLINLKKDIAKFSRQTDAKLALLREVIKRVREGEDVDVEKVLGTGDPASEKEWEDVMKEIQSDDHLWQESKWKARRKAAKARTSAEESEEQNAPEDGFNSVHVQDNATRQDARPRFY